MPLPSVDEKTAVTASPGETTSRAQRLAALRLERQKGRAQSQKLDERAASARGRHPGLALIDEARRLKASMHEARRKLREAERSGTETDAQRDALRMARAAAEAAAEAAFPARYDADMHACWHHEPPPSKPLEREWWVSLGSFEPANTPYEGTLYGPRAFVEEPQRRVLLTADGRFFIDETIPNRQTGARSMDLQGRGLIRRIEETVGVEDVRWKVHLTGTFELTSTDGSMEVNPFEADSSASATLGFALAQETPRPSAADPIQCTLHNATYIYEEWLLKADLLEEASTVEDAPGEEAWPDALLDVHRRSICHSLQLEAEELAAQGAMASNPSHPAVAPEEWFDERFPTACRKAQDYDADLESGDEEAQGGR
jgi:hypothetical protein